MKRKVYTDGNGGSSVLIEGLGAYVPKVELEALKAQVEQLKTMLKQQANIVMKYTYPLPDKDCTYSRAKDAMDYCEKLPAQCLAARDAEIKAQALDEAIRNGIKVDLTHYTIEQYANQLRQQVKAGE